MRRPTVSLRTRRRAVTLVELLVAISIVAILSTAVAFMLRAGAMVSLALTTSMDSQWEVESSLARMVQLVRTCTSCSVPTGVSGGTGFSLVTQRDADNGSATYAVSYALVTASDGTRQLQETDPRFGTNVLVHNVQSFDVRTKSATGAQVILLTISAGRGVPVQRTVCVTPRNQ